MRSSRRSMTISSCASVELSSSSCGHGGPPPSRLRWPASTSEDAQNCIAIAFSGQGRLCGRLMHGIGSAVIKYLSEPHKHTICTCFVHLHGEFMQIIAVSHMLASAAVRHGTIKNNQAFTEKLDACQ